MTRQNSRAPTPSRRALLRTAAAAASGAVLGGGLAGCGAVRAGFTGGDLPPEVLTYWNLLGGGDGVRMKDMEAVYERENQDVDLRAVTLTWGNPYYTKLSLATLGAQPPDVAISHLTRVPTLVEAELLQPFPSAALERHGMTPDQFVERAMELATIDGQVYAIPLDTHPFVMFYNTEICGEAGLLDADGRLRPLDDLDDFIAALLAAKEVTGAWGGALSIIGDIATPWRIFFSLYSQLRGELLMGDAPDEILEPDKALEVIELLRRLTVEEEVLPSRINYGEAVATFVEGRAGFYFQGEWEISTFFDAEVPFSMERFPHLLGTEYAVQADSHTFILPGRREMTDERLDLALGFIRSMLDQGMTWAQGGHVPTWLPIQESAEYQALEPQSNYAEVAEAAAYDPPAWYSGSGSNLEVRAGSVISEVLAGRMAPETAVTRIQNDLSELARTASPL